MAEFTLAGSAPAQIYIDPADTNYKGIRIAAEAFAGDVFAVTGKKPEIISTAAEINGPVIVVGTMAQNPVIAAAVEQGALDLEEIEAEGVGGGGEGFFGCDGSSLLHEGYL